MKEKAFIFCGYLVFTLIFSNTSGKHLRHHGTKKHHISSHSHTGEQRSQNGTYHEEHRPHTKVKVKSAQGTRRQLYTSHYDGGTHYQGRYTFGDGSFSDDDYHQHDYNLVPKPYPVEFVNFVPEPFPVDVPVLPHYHESHIHLHHKVRPNPCLNGGIFVKTHRDQFCICPREFRGDHCQDRNYCASSPCRNHATCVEVPGNYRCLCAREFMGYNCEDINPCYPNPCKNGGQCAKSDDDGGFTCFCKHNFSGKKCTEINQCDPNPCLNDGSCLQKGDKYECTCSAQYKGSICGEVNFCYNQPCLNGGVCHDDGDFFNCTCKEGFVGHSCEEHVCHPNPCSHGGQCSVESGHYKCSCPRLFKGEHCEIPHPCATAPCLNGGVCLDSYSGYSGYPHNWNQGFLHYLCVCKDGYRGNHCEDNICHHCDINAKCYNGSCICNDGYRGTGFKCEKIPHPCHPNPCRNGGVCRNTEGGGYDCMCKLGFSGQNCLDKDPCKPNPCQNNADCVATADETSFNCVCKLGFTGPTCSRPTDPCKQNPCMNEGTCYNDNGKAKCRCLGKWMQPFCRDCGCPKSTSADYTDQLCDRQGECYCADPEATISEAGCSRGSRDSCQPNPCLNNGICTNLPPNAFTCACPRGYSGATCEKEICNPNPCMHDGTCEPMDGGTFRCRCKGGYSGPTCEKEISIFKKGCDPNPCRNGGACSTFGPSYDCTCGPRYTGAHCEVDKCDRCDKQAVCERGNCRCKIGFVGNGYKCAKRRHIVRCNRVCPLNSYCQNNACHCMPGFTMNHQGLCVDESVLGKATRSADKQSSWYFKK